MMTRGGRRDDRARLRELRVIGRLGAERRQHEAGAALELARDHARPHGATNDDRLGQGVSGRGREPVGADVLRHLSGLEGDAAARRPDPGDHPRGLDEIARADRREELDHLVGPEQALVAVEADEQLGRDVAEEAEHTRAVDELARVVRVVRTDAQTQGHG
jgi:hypothetical protein